jgi:hypothetical protein
MTKYQLNYPKRIIIADEEGGRGVKNIMQLCSTQIYDLRIYFFILKYMSSKPRIYNMRNCSYSYNPNKYTENME